MMMSTIERAIPVWQKEIESESQAPSLRRLALAATAVVALGFGSFGVWAFTASLDSAVPAPGSVVVESKRKTVSILDSGILKELLVHEGDRVTQGQPLLQLDVTQVQAQLGQLRAQYWATMAKAARLRAEGAEASEMQLPPELVNVAAQDSSVALIASTERQVFQTRLQTYKGQLKVEEAKIAGLQEQIAAFQAQAKASEDRLRYVEEELRTVAALFAKGYERKPRLLELQRQKAELSGNIGELVAKEAEARQQIATIVAEKVSTENTRRSDAMKELQDSQALINDLSERIRGAADVVQRKEVLAPDAGVVTDVKYFTPGSSILAGQPIMDIVPAGDRMLVEARVNPNDIENVHIGQKVNVRLLAFKASKVPILTGTLAYVSADRQQDPKGDTFFIARAELDKESLAGMKHVHLYPGMPAEVLILGGERLAIDYFLTPIENGLRRALREE
jgi:HlyD family secretion protein